MKNRPKRGPQAVHRVLADAPREPAKWLRPTFLVTRGTFSDFNTIRQLPPIYIAVLAADAKAGTATYEILGSNASPVTVGLEMLRAILEQRGVKQ
jgi:hypothetical protein